MMRSLRVLLGSAAVVASVSSCGIGTGDGGQLVSFRSAVEASSQTTAHVVVAQEYGENRQVTFQGDVDFDGLRAVMRSDVTGLFLGGAEPGGPGYPDDESGPAAVMSGASELRLIGPDIYLKSDKQWWSLGPAAAGDAVAWFWSPIVGLGDGELDSNLRLAGTGEIRGIPVTRLEGRSGKLQVWIDDAGRAVRVIAEFEEPQDGRPTRLTVDISGFDARVDVRPPTDAEPLGPSQTREPTIVMRDVATGTTDGVAWRLQVADAPDGRQCVQVITDPPLDGEAVSLGGPGGSQVRTFDASDSPGASCGPVPGPKLGSSGAILLAVGGRDSNVHYVAGLIDASKRVVLHFDDRRVDLENHEGAFVVFFSGDDWPVSISGPRTSCQLQGGSKTSGIDEVC